MAGLFCIFFYHPSYSNMTYTFSNLYSDSKFLHVSISTKTVYNPKLTKKKYKVCCLETIIHSFHYTIALSTGA